jgi:hypothetical protein
MCIATFLDLSKLFSKVATFNTFLILVHCGMGVVLVRAWNIAQCGPCIHKTLSVLGVLFVNLFWWDWGLNSTT